MSSTTTVTPSSESSYRDQILAGSSPLRNLFLSMIIIAILIVGFFFSWVYFRRKRKSSQVRSQYGQLTEDEEDLDLEAFPCPTGLETNSGASSDAVDPLHVEMGSKSPPEMVLPHAAVIGLRRSRSQFTQPGHIPSSNLEGVEPASLPAVDDSVVDLSIEALVAPHIRQVQQRERFIHDRRNIGLRHMAMEQIRVQQRYEKRIMQIKAANRKVKT